MIKTSTHSLFFLALLGVSPVSYAQDTPRFIFPLACHYGQECWAVNYVDVDLSTEGVKDFKCNQKSYNAHKGTDFALGSVAQMRRGVDVLAVADGVVKRVRDGQSDHLKMPEEIDALKAQKKECGNGILMDHGDGLQTIYCHLKKDSIVVEPDQNVRVGEKIAQVGQSGMAEFPHLHIGVIQNGKILDPYTGLGIEDGCGQHKHSLWHEGLGITYEPVAIFDGGFRSNAPDFEYIKRGEENPESLSMASAAFVFWAGLYNVEAGDSVVLEIFDPEGAVFSETTRKVEKTRALQYYFTGRKLGHVQLREGLYKGRVRLERGKDIVRERDFTIQVTP